jgi:hypothetical protein
MFTRIVCDVHRLRVMFTRIVWCSNASFYDFYTQMSVISTRSFDTHKWDYDTYDCDFNTHKSDFYTQSVISTRRV